MKPLFMCLFLKAAIPSSPAQYPRIEMDDLSDKGNRFQHYVIRQRKNWNPNEEVPAYDTW